MATHVARGPSSAEVFKAVTSETGERDRDPQGARTVLARAREHLGRRAGPVGVLLNARMVSRTNQGISARYAIADDS